MTRTLSPHLARAAHAMARGAKEARRTVVLRDAALYAERAYIRARLLTGLDIPGEPHAAVIAALRDHLTTDTWMRRHKPWFAHAPVYRWALLGALIGERRLARTTRANADDPTPTHPRHRARRLQHVEN